MFTVLDNINYEKFIRTGSIIFEDQDEGMPYVHRHPHLFQSPLAAINFCIVDHALHRINGKAKMHESLLLIHLKLEPAQPHLIKYPHGIFEAITSRSGVGTSHGSLPQHQQVCQDIMLSSRTFISVHQ